MTTTNRMKKISLFGGVPLAAAGILGASLFGTSLAGAASTDTTPTTTATTTMAQPGQDQDTYIADLAKNLGIDEATLRAALKTTNLQEVAQAVTDGKLTADQAQKITDQINSGDGSIGVPGLRGGPDGGGFDGGPGGRGGFGGPGMGVSQDDLATFLGITTDQLHTELEADGATLATVAQAHGKSRDELKTYLTAQNATRLDQAVTDGKITTDEAATRKADFASHLDELIDATHQQGGDRGPRGGGMPGPNGGSAPSTTPTTTG
jgi:hypothetical protein